MRALRALARVELRASMRHRARSLLVVALVAVPVAALAGGGALLEIATPTLEELRRAAMGRATLRVDLADERELERARALVPSAARVDELRFDVVALRTPGRRLAARCVALDVGGAAEGMVRVVEGRAARNEDELALSPLLLESLGLRIGERVALDRDEPRFITGCVASPEALDSALVLLAPRSPSARGARALFVELDEGAVDETVRALRAAGMRATARGDIEAGDGFESLAAFVLGGFGCFEAALVVAAAFGVGLRRRQRELGLLGATGAPPGGMRAAILVAALALATLGCALGLVLGLGAAAALTPLLDGWNGRVNGGFEASLAHALGALALGLVTAGAAAALPARTAVRLPIRAALGGRRPVTSSARSWLALGLTFGLAGIVLLAAGSRTSGAAAASGVLGGSILVAAGLASCGPWWLDALARRAARLPLAWRLAVRDAGRFRARNGPVVAAVLAGMALSVAVAALVASVERSVHAWPPSLRADELRVEGAGAEEVAERIAHELGAPAAAPLHAVRDGTRLVRVELASERGGAWLACGDEELVRALGAEAGLDAFRAGRVLVLGVHGDDAREGVLELGDGARPSGIALDFVSLPIEGAAREPRCVVSRSRLAALGLDVAPPPGSELAPWIVRLEAPVSDAVLERAREIAAASPGTAVDAQLLHRRPARRFPHALLAACVLSGLVVVLVATALSAVESAADARVLHAVGAPPGLLRRHAAARAGYLAFLGCALAVPAGLVPALGLMRIADVELVPAIPWPEIAGALFALPALAYGITWIHARLRPPASIARASS